MTGLLGRYVISYHHRADVYFVLGPRGTFGPFPTQAAATVFVFGLQSAEDARTELQLRESAQTANAQQEQRELYDRIFAEVAYAMARRVDKTDPTDAPLFVEVGAPAPENPSVGNTKRHPRRP